MLLVVERIEVVEVLEDKYVLELVDIDFEFEQAEKDIHEAPRIHTNKSFFIICTTFQFCDFLLTFDEINIIIIFEM